MRAGTDWEGVAMGEAACDDRTRRRRRRRRVLLREIRTLEEMQAKEDRYLSPAFIACGML
jgi:hypothetical protein